MSSILGVNGDKSFTSLDGVVSGLELIIDSTSQIKVFSDSSESSQLTESAKKARVFLTERICLSQMRTSEVSSIIATELCNVVATRNESAKRLN